MSRRRSAKIESILGAAQAVIDDSGYTGLSMRVISGRLGMSASTLYFYFRTKEEIFLTLVQRRLVEFKSRAEDICRDPQDFESLYRAFADEYRDYYEHYGRYLNVWALLSDPTTVEAIPEPLIAQLRGVLASIFDIVRRAGESVLGAPIEPLTVPFLWVTLTGLAETFTGPRAQAHLLSWDDLVGFSARSVLHGLVSDPPTGPTGPRQRTARGTQ